MLHWSFLPLPCPQAALRHPAQQPAKNITKGDNRSPPLHAALSRAIKTHWNSDNIIILLPFLEVWIDMACEPRQQVPNLSLKVKP